MARREITVRGIVQGVGFRPFVFGLARDLDLKGTVLNDARGVVIDVEGSEEALAAFQRALVGDAPPLAVVEHVGQPAVELEGEADRAGGGRWEPWPFELAHARLEDHAGYEEDAARDGFEIRFGPAIRALAEGAAAGMDRAEAAARFHATVVAAIAAGAERACRERGLRVVTLSGGTFQNAIVLEGAIDALAAAGLDVRINEQVSPNDGGIALGQAAVAARAGVVESGDR